MTILWESSPPSAFSSEADVEQRLVLPLLYALGYDSADIASKYPVQFREGRRGRKPEADFVCFNGTSHSRDNSLLVVETKAPNQALDGGKEQGESYAANLRAPVLLMTNGSHLQVWQLQITRESEKMIDLAVVDLLANRGRLEALLSKRALVTSCERLSVKSFVKEAGRHKEYRAAVVLRRLETETAIKRTLRYKDRNQATLPSVQLMSAHPEGAIILAPSGYGKSTLSRQILRQATERNSGDGEPPLPFLVPLSAIERGIGSLLKYMQQRLDPYSPGMTIDALKESLRLSGGVIVCDSFDRVPAASRIEVESELTNMLRDFPLVQLFVLSRGSVIPELPLPVFDLSAPSEEEMRELEILVLGHTAQSTFVASMMPRTLRNICENILVARLAFEYLKKNGQLPVELGLLFRAWLDRLLQGNTLSSSKAVWLESALTVLAERSVDAPIRATEAACILKSHHIESTTIEELIERDALRVHGISLELQHEALADYLRARQLASASESELISKLSTISISKDSLFPTLLMSQLRSRYLQSIFWRRISQTKLEIYLDALRYRFDLSEELQQLDPEALSRGYLEDLLDGIEIPLNAFCPVMRKPVVYYLTLQEDVELGITGIVQGPPVDEVAYGFRGNLDGNRVIVARPGFQQNIRSTSWLHLGRSGYRLDSGRLLGTARLRDSLLKLIENQEMKGGTAWVSERLIGRIWHLQRAHHLELSETDPFYALEQKLKMHAGQRVPYGKHLRDWISVDAMLQDISDLRSAGIEKLDLWWREYGWIPNTNSQSEGVMECVLAEFYRRRQIVLREVVEQTFPVLAAQIPCYSSLPERYDITLTHDSRELAGFQVHGKWRPVASWDEAGADVRFADCPHPWSDDNGLREALEKLGRPANRYTIEWNGPMPSFEGYWWDGRFPCATALVREVCSLLKEDIEHLFSALPSHETISLN
jgi:Type I restriction enzyme R protein N terminus (HSDR_N)